MDIYQIIKSDHAITHGLIDRITAVRSPEWRYILCRELMQAIQAHAKAKRLAFYGPLAVYPEIAPRLAQAQEEHDIAETFLKEALSLDPEDPNFMRLFREARAEIEHQITSETGEIFSLAREVWNAEQADMAGERMRALKDEIIEADYMGSASLRADAGYYS